MMTTETKTETTCPVCGAAKDAPPIETAACDLCRERNSKRNNRLATKRARIENLREASRLVAMTLSGPVGSNPELVAIAKRLAQEADGICVMREIEWLPLGVTCPACGEENC